MSEKEKAPKFKKPRGMSRKKFLKLTGATVAGVALLGPSACAPLPEAVNPNILRNEMENKFGIEVQTYGETHKTAKTEEDKYYPYAWRVEQLEKLRQYLTVLPEHFYRLPGSNRRILTVYGGLRSYCCRVGETSGCPVLYHGQPYSVEQPIVVLEFGVLEPERGRSGLEKTAHEFTHLIKPIEGYEEIQPPDQSERIKAARSPWHAKLEEIWGKSYVEIHRQISGRVEEKYREKTRDPEQEWFYTQLNYAFSRAYEPIEFIPILSERYLHGEKDFLKRYSEFFPPDISQSMYDFTRDEVFKGKAYVAFPLDLPRRKK